MVGCVVDVCCLCAASDNLSVGLSVLVIFFFKQKTAYGMSISDWSSDVCSSDLIQARVRPNPTISVDMDNAAGTGGYGLFKQSEMTVTYSQPIERGGKRSARMALAERGVVLDEAHWRVVRRDIAQQGQTACIAAQIAELIVCIAQYRVPHQKEMGRARQAGVKG